jgi:hypothetical protein
MNQSLDKASCGPGSIPPRATKNHNSPLVGLFLFQVLNGAQTLRLACLVRVHRFNPSIRIQPLWL